MGHVVDLAPHVIIPLVSDFKPGKFLWVPACEHGCQITLRKRNCDSAFWISLSFLCFTHWVGFVHVTAHELSGAYCFLTSRKKTGWTDSSSTSGHTGSRSLNYNLHVYLNMFISTCLSQHVPAKNFRPTLSSYHVT